MWSVLGRERKKSNNQFLEFWSATKGKFASHRHGEFCAYTNNNVRQQFALTNYSISLLVTIAPNIFQFYDLLCVHPENIFYEFVIFSRCVCCACLKLEKR